MAHADYDCCAICDGEMVYRGFGEASTKQSICTSCLVKLRDMGLHIITVDELIEWINKTPKDTVVEILKKLRFRACYYVNKVDDAVEKKGIKFDENRYILDEKEVLKEKGYVLDDGNSAIVVSRNKVYFYAFNGNKWVLQECLEPKVKAKLKLSYFLLKQANTINSIINFLQNEAWEYQVKYITFDDIRDIMDWDDKVAEAIWRKIKDLANLGELSLISSLSCPWCIKSYDYCPLCSYRERHGICDLKWSDTGMIRRSLWDVYDAGVCDRRWVDNTIREIEQWLSQ